MNREKEIYRVTLLGSAVNVLLTVFKFVAAIAGTSAAMMADAVHSLSDLITDFIVLVFVRISSKPADRDHHYGHGKYETLATTIVGLILLVIGATLLAGGVEKIVRAINGEVLPVPGTIALWAALVSIVAKELVYQITIRVGKRVQSDVVIANAWHHRTDSFSSIGTGLGIGGALLLGEKWAVLDPIAAVVVSVFIVAAAAKLLKAALAELLEKSLPEEDEEAIRRAVEEDPAMSEVHNLRTRRIGSRVSIEMHLRMPGEMSLDESHRHSMSLEQRLRAHFGPDTLVNIHIEPLKVNGEYV